MKYSINHFSLGGFMSLPAAVAEKHLKIASHTQLKVILWVFKNGNTEIDEEKVAEGLKITVTDAKDALDYWSENGILVSEGVLSPKEEKPAQKKTVRAATIKPDRNEVARRGLESKEISFLLQEAQKKFGRALKQSEASTIVWLYDDEGLDVSLMLMLFEHAYQTNNFRIGAIERIAVEWIDNGVTDVKQAEDYLVMKKEKQNAWATVERAMGIPHRKPSQKEEELAHLWVEEWKISFDLLREAYNVCIDATAKLSFPYISKIIEKWHAAGITTVEETKNIQAKDNKVNGKKGSTNLDLAKKMMFTDDDLGD